MSLPATPLRGQTQYHPWPQAKRTECQGEVSQQHICPESGLVSSRLEIPGTEHAPYSNSDDNFIEELMSITSKK